MTVFGARGRFGVLIPAANTTVESAYARLPFPGVSFHYGRIGLATTAIGSDSGFAAMLDQMRDSVERAATDLVAAGPDYVIMGMSAETLGGGVAGNDRLTQQIADLTKTPVSTGAVALTTALERFGARRIGVVTPYQPVGDENVRQFFTEAGFDIVALEGLKCPTPRAIAEVSDDRLRQALIAVNLPDADALVQVGTNLPLWSLADEAERWLGKPVLAINIVTLWYSLRDHGVTDTADGLGRLFREF